MRTFAVKAALVAVAVLSAVACDAEVRAVVAVSDDSLSVVAQVVLRGEAAEVVRDDTTGLVDAVADSAGVRSGDVEVRDDDAGLVAEVALGLGQLSDAAGLSGVAELELSAPPDGGGGRAVVATLVHPQRLREVVSNAAADAGRGGEDTRAVIDAALGSVEMVLEVRFEGGVRDAYFNPAPNNQPGAAPQLSEADGQVELRQSLARFSAGTLVAVGEPAGGGRSNLWVAAGIVAAAALGAAWTSDRRRRRGP